MVLNIEFALNEYYVFIYEHHLMSLN